MLRIVSAAVRGIAARTSVCSSVLTREIPLVKCAESRNFGALSNIVQKWSTFEGNRQNTILGCGSVDRQSILPLPPPPIQTQIRPYIKFSLRKGKRKTVKTVVKRFYRLDWGIWIRTKAGRKNRMWKKRLSRKIRLRRHVFVNATQSTLLDRMVCRFWHRKRFYVDDPYNPYHEREEFPHTRKKPIPLGYKYPHFQHHKA